LVPQVQRRGAGSPLDPVDGVAHAEVVRGLPCPSGHLLVPLAAGTGAEHVADAQSRDQPRPAAGPMHRLRHATHGRAPSFPGRSPAGVSHGTHYPGGAVRNPSTAPRRRRSSVARAGVERKDPVRWPAFLAVGVAAALYALLPSAITVLPRVLIPAIALVLLVPIAVIHRRRMTGRDRMARLLAVCLLLVLALVNTGSLALRLAK